MEGGEKPWKLSIRMQDLGREQAWLGIGNEVPAPASDVDGEATPARPPTGEANAHPPKPTFSREIPFQFYSMFMMFACE